MKVREATVEEITTHHTKAHIDLLESTATMDENELKQISQKYDYIYFHAVCSSFFVTLILDKFYNMPWKNNFPKTSKLSKLFSILSSI